MTKTFRFLNLILLVLLLGSAGNLNAQVDNADAYKAWKNSNGKGRILLDSDGNQHDTDDWAASASSVAIIANRGDRNKVVGYTYSNHIWDQTTNGDKNMDLSVVETAKKFGFDIQGQNFVDAYSNKNAAYNAIRDAVNASSADSPLFMILAGPMEVAWQGINRSQQSKRQYVYCISHSNWNDKHAQEKHGGHHWNDLKNLGVKLDHIDDQNTDFNTKNKGGRAAWNFYNNLGNLGDGFDAAYKYTKTRIDAAHTAGDASDCGMVYYLYTGDEFGNVTKLEALMRSSTGNGGTGCNNGLNTKIEAENYDKMSGVKTETTTDNGGGKNVGWINDGDWMEYCLKIPSNGTYKLELRVASINSTGKAQILLNGAAKTTVNVPNTSGWQNWKTIETATFTANAGSKTLRLRATKGGFNINWLVLKSAGTQTKYKLTVNSGNGDGNYAKSTVVNISANAAPAGKVFDKWTGNVSYIANVNSASTSLTMPAKAISVTATYKNGSSGSTEITLSPIQDAYLQGSTRYNNTLLRIENGKRVGYLMYDLSSVSGTITSAKLKLTCTSDAGNGNMNVSLGSSSNWTETNLSNSNKPSAGTLLGKLNSSYKIGTTYTWNLAAGSIPTGGKVSFVMVSTGGNDAAFGAKENSGKAPKLVITYNRSGSKATSEGNGNTNNELSVYPNPASDQLFINLDAELIEGAKLNILNSSGKLVRSELMTEQGVLNIGDLSRGVYMIQVINGDKVHVSRIIKE